VRDWALEAEELATETGAVRNTDNLVASGSVHEEAGGEWAFWSCAGVRRERRTG
jgi:hypothetical protein